MSESKEKGRITRRDFIRGGALSVFSAVVARRKMVGASEHASSAGAPLPNELLGDLAQLARKRIYIAPDDHTDYFWTAGEATYRQAFLETIDYYLDLADATAGNISQHQSRWNCDGSFWMWTYEKNKSSSDFQRLINRIKSGHISVPMNALCICPGGAPAEAVIRGMYYSGQIERRYDHRFQLAYLIENQTLPYGIVSLFAGAGARYSWKGVCGCDSLVGNAGNREHDIYWWRGPDNARLLLKWNSMLTNNNSSMGGYAEARDPYTVVDYVDTDTAFATQYPYDIIGAFGKGWDDLKTMTDEFVTVAKSQTNASREVIVSNEEDFFTDFESVYGGMIPVSGASYGNEWDLYCAALSEVSARVKRSVEKLRSAEAMAAMVSLANPNFMDGRQADRDQAWMNLGLFWEHNFGMIGPPSGLVNERIVWQNRLAGEIEDYTDTLHSDAAVELGGLIKKNGLTQQFFAYNQLSWQRTGVADFPYQNTDPVHVFDLAANSETPSQIVTIDGQRYLRILAKDVPAMGYKVFEIRSGSGQVFSDAASVSGSTLENQTYKLTLANRGAITSLIDKSKGNTEIVKPIDGRYLNDMGSGSGSIQVENAGPVSVTLRATASGPLNHTTRVTFIRDSKRIEIRNDINENFNDTHTFAFCFNLNNPTVWHEEVGAVIKASLTTNGGHYAPRDARYDWMTMNHFADIGNGALGVTLSNADCYFMKVGSSNTDNLDTSTPRILALIGGHVAAYGGLPDQGGDDHFLQRFALQTNSGFNAVSSMKFALEHQNPLITGAVTGGNTYPANSYSFLSISDPTVLLWALKPADDGPESGLIARVWNLDSQSKDFELTLSPGPIVDAQRTTHIETPIEGAIIQSGRLKATVGGNQLRTYALSLDEDLPNPVPPPPPPTPKLPPAAYMPTVTSTIAIAKNQKASPTAPVESGTAESVTQEVKTASPAAPPTAAPSSTPSSAEEERPGCSLPSLFKR